jgi:hypothetical protein
MARIYYVGDWAVLTGPWFAESPFQNAMKGLDVFNYGTWLTEALESTGEHEVTSVPSWDFYKLGPGEYEQVLADYDVVIFSDVEGKLFQLAPNFFDRSKFGNGVLTFPDRMRLTREAVQAGKGLMLLGGWYSFTGEQGKGGWGRTQLKDAMPVVCLDHEDLVESTEGYHPQTQAAWPLASLISPAARPSSATTRCGRSQALNRCSPSKRPVTRCWSASNSGRGMSSATCQTRPLTGPATLSSGSTTPPFGCSVCSSLWAHDTSFHVAEVVGAAGLNPMTEVKQLLGELVDMPLHLVDGRRNEVRIPIELKPDLSDV